MKLIVFGATSGLAQWVARAAAEEGHTLHLVARDAAKLQPVVEDLKVRGARGVTTSIADLAELATLDAVFDTADTTIGGADAVLIAQGILTDEARARTDVLYLEATFRLNYLGCAHLAARAADRFQQRGGGIVAVITSVAGDRGKASNAAYCASKAALSTHLSGLRQQHSPGPVTILDVRAGQADTAMTAGMKQGALVATAENVGRSTFSAMKSRKDVAYVPFFWRPIMRAVREVPEPLFKKLKM